MDPFKPCLHCGENHDMSYFVPRACYIVIEKWRLEKCICENPIGDDPNCIVHGWKFNRPPGDLAAQLKTI